MASNYWDSTQARFWTFRKPQLADMWRRLDERNQGLVDRYPLPERRLLNIYFQRQLINLGKKFNTRQQILATAQIYVRRFYTKVEIRKTNPYLVLATALYLASKMEEGPQHIRLVVAEASRLWPEHALSEIKLGEMEFHLISTLNSHLILHHPYRSLNDIAPALQLTGEEHAVAHNVVNDSYNTDLPLLYPPHVIAVTAMFLAVVLRSPAQVVQMHTPMLSADALRGAMGSLGGGRPASPAKLAKMVDWLAESKVDMGAVVDCTQELISLYDLWENYSEKACKEGIGRFMKGEKLDR
ncbi:RNA polymerase II holoenzyme cyclin-like subunit [Elasticomyces elasticus]|nr:RNA polymerase II holoenzyme cyclin-like subunit [Elasticomyces elasticus]